jgi:hypothetical protein
LPAGRETFYESEESAKLPRFRILRLARLGSGKKLPNAKAALSWLNRLAASFKIE